ncbi:MULTISPECIES: gluconeogenesis factor YvcK family protein [unclassified Arthrobacter]|uniref:gluconeogenesis factor YvcK family protein n=1 Tax=unclassified Arthrobacter TaxID=235627 RepID=UPI001492B693|nr:uridine diphosphate-N-acetylglucosamine-binding protein YvcK [Arthrobacter sp. AET 35A]MBE0010683.1 uridine diphosphate-N-acetylglucosamine-binding protein YvcK [Arthrobacter sp. AET 35A]NOJ59515.1 uridine diphosphate-N-acetylglucosamine-binding protein YvcK [Arthrobacter sp. 260]NOJ64694.1 uridine diphosphate-N-acetylglucosamine-binding protein YvcK [Arthrobacter sp. 147(2020)]
MALLTGSLPLLPAAAASRRGSGPQENAPSVVALGGGHGLSSSLSALRLLTSELTAIVTVADDGGSSGKLRKELGVLPPGDLRMALAALCDDTDWGRTWRDVMQHRFTSKEGVDGSLDNHALGNLLIVTLWELLGDPVAGLQWAGALLGARGRVLPMASVPLTIEGDVLTEENGSLRLRTVSGQSQLAVAGSAANVNNVRLLPAGAPACVDALTAVELADWVILGPGSWYTSVLPHLLLPELRDALCSTTAKRCLTMNLSNETKETAGMSAVDHLEVIKRYAPDFTVDVVIADPAVIGNREQFIAAVAEMGGRAVLGKVGSSTGKPVHDPLRLATAFHDMFGEN